MVRTGGARVEDATAPLAVQRLANSLERFPGSPIWAGSWQINLHELGLGGEVGDVVDGDRPPP